MTVITLSRQFGSGGDEIAELVCEQLGYCKFDRQLVSEAAERAGLPKRMVVDYSEDNHEVRRFLNGLFYRTPSPCQKIAWAEDPSIASRPERSDVDDLAVIGLIRRAIKAAVQVDNIVIVGRGGQALLKDTPGVLHVRVEAPLEERIQRVKAQMKASATYAHGDIETRRAAQDLVLARDAASEDYIRRYYDVDWADPLLYHLLLNTGKMSIEQAAGVVIALARAAEAEKEARAVVEGRVFPI